MSHKKLISLAFQKAEREEVKKGNPRPSKSEKASALSIAVIEINKHSPLLTSPHSPAFLKNYISGKEVRIKVLNPITEKMIKFA
jgi:hypothetical protein